LPPAPIDLVHFVRKPTPFAFSLEVFFREVRQHLPADISCRVETCRHSDGILGRIGDTVRMARRQGDVNHITGDVHYLDLFFHKRKTVLTIADCVSLTYGSRISRFAKWLIWYGMPVYRCAVITVISEATRQELLNVVRIDPSKVRVIYIAVSPAIRPAPRAFNSEKPTILQVGTSDNKNVLRLVEALRGIPCRLSLIGPVRGPLRAKLEECGIEWESGQALSEAEVVQRYVDCDLVSFVSTYEGFGMPIVEANVVERPVIAGNVTSMPEIAGDAACLVDPYDVQAIRQGVLRIINDEGYRETLIANGRTNRERFRIETIAAQYAGIYRELAGRERPPCVPPW
jgi:glycosyltransferase involved in cell wall biosynthesis